MATFITTIKFTKQGVKAIGETKKRADAFKTAVKKMGVKVNEIYWTLGAFDGAIIFDAADDETAAAGLCSPRGSAPLAAAGPVQP